MLLGVCKVFATVNEVDDDLTCDHIDACDVLVVLYV
jgi:hypothetical protein